MVLLSLWRWKIRWNFSKLISRVLHLYENLTPATCLIPLDIYCNITLLWITYLIMAISITLNLSLTMRLLWPLYVQSFRYYGFCYWSDSEWSPQWGNQATPHTSSGRLKNSRSKCDRMSGEGMPQLGRTPNGISGTTLWNRLLSFSAKK